MSLFGGVCKKKSRFSKLIVKKMSVLVVSFRVQGQTEIWNHDPRPRLD